MKGARESYDDAERALQAAQARLVELQGARGVLSTDVEVSSQMSIINAMELELETKKLEQQEILSNPRPNQTRAELNAAEIARLEQRIAALRDQMTANTGDSASLAKIAGELRLAETEVTTRQFLLQQAVTQMETARIEANRQVRYLAMGVTPVAPDAATLPRKFESTALSLVVFAGLYLLASLTVSILREQVSV
jgi:capsular polysaccharide transport system permease protein